MTPAGTRLGGVPRYRRRSHTEVNVLDNLHQHKSPHAHHPFHQSPFHARAQLPYTGGSTGSKNSSIPHLPPKDGSKAAAGAAAHSPFELNNAQRGGAPATESFARVGRTSAYGVESRRQSSSGLSIFDLELDAEDLPSCPLVTPLPDSALEAISRLHAQLAPADKFAKSLHIAATKLRDACGKSQLWGYSVDTAELGQSLVGLGYEVDFRTTGARRGLHLSHCYLWVTSDRASGQGLVVDPNYKETFAVAAVSGHSHFDAILAKLPDCFVGTRPQLTELVLTLAAFLKDAFAAVGKSMPPWRSARTYLSRWNMSLDGDSPPFAVTRKQLNMQPV